VKGEIDQQMSSSSVRVEWMMNNSHTHHRRDRSAETAEPSDIAGAEASVAGSGAQDGPMKMMTMLHAVR
jgi:hypothetical protein